MINIQDDVHADKEVTGDDVDDMITYSKIMIMW